MRVGNLLSIGAGHPCARSIPTPRVLAMARAGYGHLPDESPLWLLRRAGGPGWEVERLTSDRRAEIAQLLGDEDELELVAEDPGPWTSRRHRSQRLLSCISADAGLRYAEPTSAVRAGERLT